MIALGSLRALTAPDFKITVDAERVILALEHPEFDEDGRFAPDECVTVEVIGGGVGGFAVFDESNPAYCIRIGGCLHQREELRSDVADHYRQEVALILGALRDLPHATGGPGQA